MQVHEKIRLSASLNLGIDLCINDRYKTYTNFRDTNIYIKSVYMNLKVILNRTLNFS